ncbi:MAG TPA: helix-turn-helix transcriptional regulator [Anaerolineaceae bacterium]|nr:helix-turn-helix transcriptional regulator [Anaerolineaceae bacterium]
MTDLQQVRKGSTPLLILGILSQGPMHGYAIMRELEKRSEGYFNMTAALLYPALHQMEQDDLIQGKWDESKGMHRRKVYEITRAGLERLASGQADWRRFAEQLFKMLGGATAASGEVNEH